MRDLIGRTLGHYRIVERIGAGGMGEVYRATDERLDRDVAIKVLPDEVGQDPERLTRFEREAKLLASLSHQNIATLYGLEEHEGQGFLIMELVEGETLAERIERAPIPIEDALDYARQIAEGLEAAHEKGIIHRDLKPANVMLSPEGQIKILDFGLAKALEPPGSEPSSAESIADSPTLTAGMTRTGVLLGTAAYMSPEQARGKAVDKRADIWAFGCVFYEMLARRKAFQGDDGSQTIAAILRDDPDWTSLPGAAPGGIRRLLVRCLNKDARARLHDIADARIAIEEAGENEVVVVAASSSRSNAARAGTTIALVALGIITGSIGVWWFAQPTPEPLVAVQVETKELLRENTGGKYIAISPDGRHLIYVVTDGFDSFLVHRPLDRFEAVAIPGSEGAIYPFFSPDSQWVGFSAKGKLKKVSLHGGKPVDLCEGCGGAATWSPNGEEILFTNVLDNRRSLRRVSAVGGEVTVVRQPGSDQHRFGRPEYIPDGRAILLQVCEGPGYGACSIGVLDLETEEIEILVSQGTDPTYSASGHVLFTRNDELFAVAFDVSRRRCLGEPVGVLQGVESLNGHASQYSVSRQGRLAYIEWYQPSWILGGRRLVWVDRSGQASPLSDRRNAFGRPSLSPDGRRVAVRIVDSDAVSQIEVYEIETATWTRLTTGEGWKNQPIWTPDGSRLLFAVGGSTAPGWVYSIFSMASDFSSDELVSSRPETRN